MKRPSFQFYPADWRKDSALQSCSIAAQGLWVNMLCIAHECAPYGHLAVNSRPMQAGQLARLVGLSEKECGRYLGELDAAGVYSKTEEGAIYSRRMVADEDVRNKRANGGEAGGEHGHKGGIHGAKGGRPRGDKKTPLNPPPSSSSSSSPSGSVPDGTGGKPPGNPIRDEIWARAMPLLKAQFADGPELRSFLAKLCKDYGEFLVVEAVRDAERTQPLEAKSWLVARCQERRDQAGNKQSALERRNAAVVEQALREHGRS